MGRPKIKTKKENISIYLSQTTLSQYKQHCEDHNIENYSDNIEKLIMKYMNDDNDEVNKIKK